MMQIEEKFSKTDLSPFKDTKEKMMAKNIIQYQDYKTSIAIDKMNCIGYADNTIKAMFNCGVSYLKTGKTNSIINSIIPYIEELKGRYVALKPKDSERRITYTKRIRKPAKVVEQPVETKKTITETFTYGLEIDGKIQLFKSEDERTGYLRAVSDCNHKANIKLCHVKVEYED